MPSLDPLGSLKPGPRQQSEVVAEASSGEAWEIDSHGRQESDTNSLPHAAPHARPSLTLQIVKPRQRVHRKHRLQILHRRILISPSHPVRSHPVDHARHPCVPVEPRI